jgi:hypothetical protein
MAMATPQTHISQLFLGVARTADLALLQTTLALFPTHRLSERDGGVFWSTLIRALPTYAEENLSQEVIFEAFQHCEAVAGSPFLLYNPTLSVQVLDACSSTDWWEGLHKKSTRLDPFATLVDFLMTHPEAVEGLKQQHQNTGYHPVVKALAKYNPTAIDFFVQQGGDLNALYSSRPHSLNQEAASERYPLYAFATDQELSLKRLKRHGMDFSLPITLHQHRKRRHRRLLTFKVGVNA